MCVCVCVGGGGGVVHILFTYVFNFFESNFPRGTIN